MGKRLLVVALLFWGWSVTALGQGTAVGPQASGVIDGYATDADGADIPGAIVLLEGSEGTDKQTTTSDGTGFFVLNGVRTGEVHHLTVTAKGFLDYKSGDLTVTAGQELNLGSVKLPVGEAVNVDAISPEAAAIEQEYAEEHQRVLGIIPNFYVVYDKAAPPLSAKLKYKLALRTNFDAVSVVAAAFLAGINQAADTPDYVQGAKGYGQRVGAAYTNAFTDVLLGGAVLPALFHQDPRYFYQGDGTKKSRVYHALESPFICHGDNGKNQFNYSSVGGDLASGALSNIYYPRSNRGPGLVFESAAILTGGRMLSALAQEFVLNRLTTRGKNPK